MKNFKQTHPFEYNIQGWLTLSLTAGEVYSLAMTKRYTSGEGHQCLANPHATPFLRTNWPKYHSLSNASGPASLLSTGWSNRKPGASNSMRITRLKGFWWMQNLRNFRMSDSKSNKEKKLRKTWEKWPLDLQFSEKWKQLKKIYKTIWKWSKIHGGAATNANGCLPSKCYETLVP